MPICQAVWDGIGLFGYFSWLDFGSNHQRRPGGCHHHAGGAGSHCEGSHPVDPEEPENGAFILEPPAWQLWVGQRMAKMC